MITSADNEKLKTIRKLQQKRWRTKLGLFSAEGEDLVEAAPPPAPEPEPAEAEAQDAQPEAEAS